MYFTDIIYYTIISKIRQSFFLKSDRKKRSKIQVDDIILDACMKFENYPIKTFGEMHFTVTIYYTIISKIRQKFKNSAIVKESTSHVSDIILDGCMQLENFPIKM